MRKFISTNFRTDHCSSSGGREIRMRQSRIGEEGNRHMVEERERERQIEDWQKTKERETE